MFTGLIEDVGRVVRTEPRPEGRRLVIQTRLDPSDLFHGASLAVDGCCLTVVDRDGDRFAFDVSAESLARTTLGERREGDAVNLERPMAVGERLGGHIVLGHVDGVGELASRTEVGNGVRLEVRVPPALEKLIVEKGSIALDGISLTVNELLPAARLALFLIPETLRATTWGTKPAGARINVEADVLGKHVARLLQFKEQA